MQKQLDIYIYMLKNVTLITFLTVNKVSTIWYQANIPNTIASALKTNSEKKEKVISPLPHFQTKLGKPP